MLRIDRKNRTLEGLQQRSITEAGLLERTDLQQMIRRSPDAFFKEMGEPLLLLGEEVRPVEFVDDRIDLLAIDREGAVVVIELKRGNNKLQLLQAISYAAMVAEWKRERLIRERAALTKKPDADAEEEIEEFLLEEITDLNESQRVVLLAENFDYEVLVAADWLSKRYDVDVRCFRLALSADAQNELLTCTCIYPPPEITQVAVNRRTSTPRPRRWTNWNEAIAAIENPAVAGFFRRELEQGHDGPWRSRVLRFHIADRPRFSMKARQKNAYVWQRGRFAEDVAFWTKRLSDGADVTPVENGQALRFFLSTDEDFGQFTSALHDSLQKVQFVNEGPESDEDGPGA
jgi:hypothetical protein